MSIKRLNTSASRYLWRKTGINIYQSEDGTVEASVVHHWSGEQGYSQLTFRWSNGLAVEGWLRDGEKDADGWRATWGDDFVDVHGLPQLPHGTDDVVWGIFILIGMAGRKAARF